jgi:Domain of unknown function (DUF4136)
MNSDWRLFCTVVGIGGDDMQAPRLFVMLGIAFLTATLARADKVTTDYDHNVNFAKYKTFMWIDEPQTEQPFMKDRIMAAVNRQLTNKGLRPVSDGADLAIGANLATEEKHTWETYYSGSGWDWGGGWSTTTEKTYQVGTLTVDLFDAQSKKLVWQGIGTDTLSRHPDKRTRDTDKQVEKMFRDYPFLFIERETLQR